MRDHLRVADGDWAAGFEIDRAPEAHVFIGWRGIPVNPVYAEIFVGLREGFHGQGIWLAWRELRGDFVFVGAIGAGYVFGVGDFAAVEPDVGAVIDAAEVEPHFAASEIFGELEVGAIPPGAA